MGIRPEHINPYPAKGVVHYAAFQAHIQFVARLGHESFAFSTLQAQQIVARLTPEETVEPLSEMALYLELEKMHFFDKGTGEAVTGD